MSIYQDAIAPLEVHPIAMMFPPMSDEAFAELEQDIQARGLEEPITLHENVILDGRHRYRACIRTETATKFQQLPPGTDPIAYVLSKNVHRRHLTQSQRAMIADQIATHSGRGRKSPNSDRITRREAADQLGCSERAVGRARRIGRECVQEVLDAVCETVITVHDATIAIGTDPDIQRRAVALVRDGSHPTLASAIDQIANATEGAETEAAQAHEAHAHDTALEDEFDQIEAFTIHYPNEEQDREGEPVSASESNRTWDDTHDDPATVKVPRSEDAERVREVLGEITIDAVGTNATNVIVRASRYYPRHTAVHWEGQAWLRMEDEDDDTVDERISEAIEALEDGTLTAAVIDMTSEQVCTATAQAAMAIAKRVVVHARRPKITIIVGTEEHGRASDDVYADKGVVLRGMRPA